jgi:hypothetical protein
LPIGNVARLTPAVIGLVPLRQRNSVQDFSDQQVSLHRRQGLGNDVCVDPQTKHCSDHPVPSTVGKLPVGAPNCSATGTVALRRAF